MKKLFYECRYEIFIGLAILIIFMSIGIFDGFQKGEYEETNDISLDWGDSIGELYFDLVSNNLEVSADSIYWGITSGTYYSFTDLIEFSYSTGLFFSDYSVVEEVSLLMVVLLGALPHGLFELSAIILTFAIPLYFYRSLLLNLYKKLKNKEFSNVMVIQSLKAAMVNMVKLLVVTILLFVISGIIEVTITGYLVETFLY